MQLAGRHRGCRVAASAAAVALLPPPAGGTMPPPSRRHRSYRRSPAAATGAGPAAGQPTSSRRRDRSTPATISSAACRAAGHVVEKAVSQWGQPNGYVLGEEAGGAFVGGLRYGDGTLYTKNAGDVRVFWQGPSVGFDAGADGARTMMLVYNLPRTEAIFERFGGIDGSAYFIGGFGMTALTANDIVVVPIRSGVGLRLGANLGYLKFTPRPTWNPF